ncbi:MAG: UvrD-helicase domain-containing protein [Flavobacteriales bacterium]|nr:UvrD-helicase domain-containing protein [Flavobacteriales bacterium]NNK79876.1 UvrD-helicase domain-containing protein [Flavobacteriales bacterium]
MSYLDELNDSQRQAVQHISGPMMVVAGAGSGKTRVLTYRIAHLIKNDVDPFSILALTFTNKAAKEMKERIAGVVGYGEARNIWMGTFHSVFARILRYESEKLGYPSNFTIYDTADSKSLLKSIIKEHGLDEKIYKPSIVFNRISGAKNNLISPEAYLENAEVKAADEASGKPRLGELYKEYAMRCFKAGAMDFDDLLYKTNILFRDFPDALHKYQHRFNYLLVDEYQDTNFAQYLIVRKLAAVHENICVVGDDAQSIYSFRGANIQNILNFRRDYPDYVLFKLEQNYRSTKTIVNAANSVIDRNKDQIKKEVWTNNEEGDAIHLMRAATDNEEGRMVAQAIFETKMQGQIKDNDFAILYRTNAQSRSMEESLRKLNIPYKIFGGLSFYQRKEIKDLLSYFRLICNPRDEEALKRIINYPTRGIGQTTIDKIILSARGNGVSLWEVIKEPARYALPINKGTAAKLLQFSTLIDRFALSMQTSSAYDLGHEVAKTTGILKELYNDKSPEGVSRYENIQELLNGIKDFSERQAEQGLEDSLSDFLMDVALLTDADQTDESEDYVSLMTIHSAKGLEFPYVYIVGMEENLFPSQLSLNTRQDLEEERRLFYVALTRAEKRATLSMANTRYRWGNLIYCEPSRFIEEVDKQFMKFPSNWTREESNIGDLGFGGGWNNDWSRTRNGERTEAPKRRKTEGKKTIPKGIPKNLKKISPSKSSGPTAITLQGIEVGAEVEHARFGKGKIVKLEGNSPDTKATIFFPGSGKKVLLLKFAKLKVLS